MRYSGLTGACINAMSFNKYIEGRAMGHASRELYHRFVEETNWSNGEVVQRGTGSNYGVDGFLRPGFSYDSVIAYLESKLHEEMECGDDVSTHFLSRDWKTKLAASLVPRGLESDDMFIGFLREEWSASVVRASTTGDVVVSLHDCLEQIIDHAQRSFLVDDRYSSQVETQPKPVDSIVDDFAVESQGFANSLAQSAAFASGTLSFRLLDTDVFNYLSSLLAGINILISFGTMTNVSRYKIRNEEARVRYFDEKLPRLKRKVFSLMSSSDQSMFGAERNPFLELIDKATEEFRRLASYYDYGDSSDVCTLVNLLKTDWQNSTVLQKARLEIVRLIATRYHENSYVQESLVMIVQALDEMCTLLARGDRKCDQASCSEAVITYKYLLYFEDKLRGSLQRGTVRWGFLKRRKIAHWDLSTVLRSTLEVLFYPLLMCEGSLRPVLFDTSCLISRLNALGDSDGHMKRGLRDTRELYWATRESDRASLVFLSGFFAFVASVTFSVARLASIGYLEDLAFWGNAASAFGATLASLHFLRKLGILIGLWRSLHIRGVRDKVSDRHALRFVSLVTTAQMFLTLTRLLSVVAATVALPWAVAENGFGSKISTNEQYPFWVASAAVTAAIFATIVFFGVEYVVRYDLPTQLGPFVCELFRDDILDLHTTYSQPRRKLRPKQQVERDAWEYTARDFLNRYRFDTVFAADRFSAILQYLQSGMDPRAEYI